jgi:serine/threonine protein kinase
MGPRELKIVLYKVIRQLKKAHDMGFFHMDIKPLNILVDYVQEGDSLKS